MLTNITLTKDHRCFKAGDSFDFRPGINFLVGDQGCGKSTLLEMLQPGKLVTVSTDGDKNTYKRERNDYFTITTTGPAFRTAYFDFERQNPRTKSHFGEGMDMRFQIAMHWKSHGQSNREVLRYLDSEKSILFIMDEPDMALSIRSILQLAEQFKKAVENGCQIIASIHNILLITSVLEVFSVEHRRWMPGEEFVGLCRVL